MRTRSGSARRATAWTIVPGIAAATAKHMEEVPAKVRCVLPMEIMRDARSTWSAPIGPSLVVRYAVAGANFSAHHKSKGGGGFAKEPRAPPTALQSQRVCGVPGWQDTPACRPAG